MSIEDKEAGQTSNDAFTLLDSESVAAESDLGRAVELHVGARNGDFKAVQQLVMAGVSPDSAPDGIPPLAEAALGGHLEVMRILVEAGANVDSTCSQQPECNSTSSVLKGDTPLLAAVGQGRLEAVQLLVAAGADVDKAGLSGCTPIYRAAMGGHAEIIRVLLGAGAEVNLGTKSGLSPLGIAVIHERLAAVQALVEGGADPAANIVSPGSRKGAYTGETPLTVAADGGGLDLVRFIMDAARDVTPGVMTSAFHGAISSGSLEVTKFLLERGAALGGLDQSGLSPISAAAKYGRVEVIQFLIEAGANPSTVSATGKTPLSEAACNGQVEAVEFLLLKGARDPKLSVRSPTVSII